MCTAAVAIARTLPLYDSKSNTKTPTKTPTKDDDDDATTTWNVNVAFHHETGEIVTAPHLHRTANAVADGVRLSAELGDAPPAELNPDAYAAICEGAATALAAGGANVTYREIVGEELRAGGYGGIYGVGMAAASPPRMIIATYAPEDGGERVEHVALCGKVRRMRRVCARGVFLSKCVSMC